MRINAVKSIFAIAIATPFLSCTTTVVDEFRQGETGIDFDESIVILGRREKSDFETRSEFVDCVGDRMGRGENPVSVVPEKEFIDAVFPWFEPRTAPLRASDLGALMAEDVIASKINEFDVKYMVWIEGFTETRDRTGSISCTIGPAGGGCFGFGTWEDDANFNAKVWDVRELASVGTISADATGQSFVPAIVIPIPLIARVEQNACIRLAEQLKGFVRGS